MLPNAHYMDNQVEIQWSMRSVLMDWLVQVHHRFSLLPETLFLCVNYIDRFLSCKIISLGKLQLVGATAILIAAKYEETNCPSVQEIVYMVNGGYTAEAILKAERFMLTMLQFELGWPGPMSFLRRISKADEYDLETRTLAKYLLEVTIMDERFVGSPPSFAAAGAHCLARLMLRKGIWVSVRIPFNLWLLNAFWKMQSPAHIYYSNYTYSQLYPIVSLILECCENPEKHHAAIFEKYTDKRFKRASLFVEDELKRGFRLPDPSKEGNCLHLLDTLDYGYHKRK
jgi:Cyclin, N-terminal domain/Cyclin, C-terminal domain